MIAKSAAEYFLIKMFPALGGVLQITLLLKGLGAAGYGEWAELFAAASLMNALALQWIPKAVSRYGDADQQGGSLVLKQLMTVQLFMSCVVVLVSLCVAAFAKNIVPLCVALIAVGESYREAVLEAARTTFRKKQYAVITIGSTAYSLVLGALAYGSLINAQGVAIAWGAGLVVLSLAYVGGRSALATVSFEITLGYLRFGVPIALSGAVGQFAYSGTRLFISSIYGKEALGVFAAAYDLLQRLLVSYMQVINSASFPLIRRAWDNDDLYQVNQLARSNVFLLAFPTLSVVGALVIMWPRLAGFFGGGVSSYWMALFIGLGVVFNRLKTFHVDYFSMLNGRTTVLVGNSFLSMGLLAALFFTFGRNGSIVVVTASVASAYFFGLLLATVGELLRKKKLRVFDFRDVAIGMLPIPVALFLLQVESRFGPYWVAVLYACFMVSFVLALWLFGYAPLRSMFSRRKRDGQ